VITALKRDVLLSKIKGLKKEFKRRLSLKEELAGINGDIKRLGKELIDLD